jgi:hypothetical protein
VPSALVFDRARGICFIEPGLVCELAFFQFNRTSSIPFSGCESSGARNSSTHQCATNRSERDARPAM